MTTGYAVDSFRLLRDWTIRHDQEMGVVRSWKWDTNIHVYGKRLSISRDIYASNNELNIQVSYWADGKVVYNCSVGTYQEFRNAVMSIMTIHGLE